MGNTKKRIKQKNRKHCIFAKEIMEYKNQTENRAFQQQ